MNLFTISLEELSAIANLTTLTLITGGRRMNIEATTYQVIAGSDVVFMARVKNVSGSYITQSSVASITVDVYDVTDGNRTAIDQTGATITTGHFDQPLVADVVLNSLLADSRWSVDSIGYGIAYVTSMPTIDHQYELRMTFAMSSGQTIVVVWSTQAK